MTISIRDDNILKSIDPPRMTDYLGKKGWIQRDTLADRAAVWVKDVDGEDYFEIIQPLKPEMPDFRLRMSEALETLEIEEERSQLEILYDLTTNRAIGSILTEGTRDLGETAKEITHEVVDLALQFPDRYSTKAPAAPLGEILYNFQRAIDTIGQVKEGKAESKIVPSYITEKTELAVTGTFSGSFGIQLIGTVFEPDMLGASFVGDCIDEFLKLVRAGANREQLSGKLLTLKKRAAFRYSNFLRSLINAGAINIRIDWSSLTPNGGGSAELSIEAAQEAIEVIKELRLSAEREFQASVRIVTLQEEAEKITLKDIESNAKYKCEVAEEALPDVIVRRRVYTAVIRETRNISPITGEETPEYELVNLELYTGEVTVPSQLSISLIDEAEESGVDSEV